MVALQQPNLVLRGCEGRGGRKRSVGCPAPNNLLQLARPFFIRLRRGYVSPWQFSLWFFVTFSSEALADDRLQDESKILGLSHI